MYDFLYSLLRLFDLFLFLNVRDVLCQLTAAGILWYYHDGLIVCPLRVRMPSSSAGRPPDFSRGHP